MINITNEKDIHERIYQFVLRVLQFLAKLPKTPQNFIFITQTTKSVTSMGANDQEADAAESKKDFIAKYSIVKKESKETIYWLRIIGDTNSSFEEEAMRLKKEGKEILNVVSTIIYNTKHGRK